MDPFMVVPGRPVANDEVGISTPMHSSHRRNRHPPLLHATEWMKAMYHKEDLHPIFKNELGIIGDGSEEAALPPKEAAKSLGHTLAEKRRGMIYTPQALRPDIPAWNRETSGTPFKSSLKRPNDPTATNGGVDLCKDGEVSPTDVSRPLFTAFADKKDEPPLRSEKLPDALRIGFRAHRSRDVDRPSTVVFPKSLPVSTAQNPAEATQCSIGTSKILPVLPIREEKESTPDLQIARKPLRSPEDKVVESLPTSPQTTKFVSATTENGRGVGFPRIDYGPVGKHTALQSHRPREEERKYSIWLSEGWKAWKSKKMLQGGRDGKGREGKRSESRAVFKPLRRGVKGLFACM